MNIKPRDAELVIGLVARLGVDTKHVIKVLVHELSKFDYRIDEIRTTDLLAGLESILPLKQTPVEDRYTTHIAACNDLRLRTDDSVLAAMSIMHIAQIRSESGHAGNVQTRHAFIVNQIKRPEESDLLRSVYGEQYVQISCHADEAARVERLTAMISDDHPEDPRRPAWEIRSRELIHTDESEEGEKHGQRVRQVFPLSDVIVDTNTPEKTRYGIERFLRALFGDKAITPTREEYGMEIANTAAMRSSDLSRQVGAAIFSPEMEIKATGCNEVPKAGGGAYWSGDEQDSRDFVLQRDSNEQRRRAVVVDLLMRLNKAGALNESLADVGAIEQLLFDREDRLISDSQIMDSLEYGRSVHAEMAAITDAARIGQATKGCTLYSNTFPCHNCAKHIVAAGLSNVIYMHPYPKSYAKELFSDSILVNPAKSICVKPLKYVTFQQFTGIMGPMYARVFTKVRWQKDKRGNVTEFVKQEAPYIRTTPLPAYLETEALLLDEWNGRLGQGGFLSTYVG